MHKRLTREQIDEILPTFNQIGLLTGAAPHLVMFATASFAAAFNLDSVKLAQIQKAANFNSPCEMDMETLNLLNEVIDGRDYADCAGVTQFYASRGFAIGSAIVAEMVGEDEGSEDDGGSSD